MRIDVYRVQLVLVFALFPTLGLEAALDAPSSTSRLAPAIREQ